MIDLVVALMTGFGLLVVMVGVVDVKHDARLRREQCKWWRREQLRRHNRRSWPMVVRTTGVRARRPKGSGW